MKKVLVHLKNNINILAGGASLLLMLTIALCGSTSVHAASTFTSHDISSSYISPGKVVSVAGSLWYLETSGGASAYIGKMSTSGATTDYDIRALSGNANLVLRSLTTGPDGNIWFNGTITSGGSPVAGRLDVSTGLVTIFASGVASYGNFGNIVSGADGNLWYYIKTAYAQNYTYLVKVNPTTGVTTAAHTFDNYTNLTSISSGPDGNIWVTDAYLYYNRVRGINVSTGIEFAAYQIPSATTTSYPSGISSGPDDNLWLIANNKYLKLTISGTFTEYTKPTIYSGGFVTGADGAMWFTDNGSVKKIGRMTPSGYASEYTVPGSSIGNISSLVLGPDGAMWFAYSDSTGGKLGSVIVTPDFSSHSISSSYTAPNRVVVAGDSLWYLENNGGVATHIGKMNTSGVTTDYDVRTLSGNANLVLRSLTVGPDDNIWFNGTIASGGSPVAGRLDVSTGVVTLFASGVASYGNFGPIVTGSDGNLWYYIKTAYAQNYTYLVKLDPATGTTTTAHTFDNYTSLSSITSGPDGNIWVTDAYLYYNRVRGVDVSTGVEFAAYQVPNATTSSYPGGLTSGSDGNLWLIANNKYLKLTPSGAFTEYVKPTIYTGGLIEGLDDAMWFLDNGSTKRIGRMASSGSISEYTLPGSVLGNLNSLILGPDGAMWFAYSDSTGGKLGRLGY